MRRLLLILIFSTTLYSQTITDRISVFHYETETFGVTRIYGRGPSVVLLAGDTLFVPFLAGSGGESATNNRMFYVISADSGKTWSKADTLIWDWRPHAFSMDAFGDTIIGFVDSVIAFPSQKLKLTMSYDKGKTWNWKQLPDSLYGIYPGANILKIGNRYITTVFRMLAIDTLKSYISDNQMDTWYSGNKVVLPEANESSIAWSTVRNQLMMAVRVQGNNGVMFYSPDTGMTWNYSHAINLLTEPGTPINLYRYNGTTYMMYNKDVYDGDRTELWLAKSADDSTFSDVLRIRGKVHYGQYNRKVTYPKMIGIGNKLLIFYEVYNGNYGKLEMAVIEGA